MNRSETDFKIRGFIDRIQKGVSLPLRTQSVAILPYDDIVYHRSTDPNNIDWVKDPYLTAASLPVGSDWLNLPKPSSYVADPLRSEQYSKTMTLEPDSFYNRRFFFGKILVYATGSTHYFQRKNWGLQFMLDHPATDRTDLTNESTNSDLNKTKAFVDLLYTGLGALQTIGSNYLTFEFSGFWILFKV